MVNESNENTPHPLKMGGGLLNFHEPLFRAIYYPHDTGDGIVHTNRMHDDDFVEAKAKLLAYTTSNEGEYSELKSYLSEHYPAAMFWGSGKRLFKMSENITDKLVSTSLDPATLEYINIPFTCIYVSIPPSSQVTGFIHGDQRWGINGFYAIHVTYTKPKKEYAVVYLYPNCINNTCVLDVAPKSSPSPTDHSNVCVSFPIPIGTGFDVEGFIRDIEAWQEEDGKRQREVAHCGAAVGIKDWRETLRIVVNSLLYISSPKADMSEPIYTRNQRRLMNASGKSDKWLTRMNRRVEADPILVKVGEAVRPIGGEGVGGWHYTKRFMRRGHWRRQACGKGRRDRVLRWIEPYWVGPTLGDRVNGRQYDVVMGDANG